ncbi:MAG TPA: NEW3 domain-containing protein [Gemmatimonadaceae bacterium]|nr:NEW3 domain-containing protein [Gemmatimonadaceae bacterium]
MRLRLVLLAAMMAAMSSAEAQSGLSIRATRRDTVRAASTVTAAFMLSNARDDTAAVRTRLELPAEWTALTGADTIRVAPRSSEMFILSVVVPARTLAGTYAVRVWVTSTDDPRGASDSVVVRVPERRATEIALLDRPGYVVSGRSYEAGFEVRNRGNLATTLHLGMRASVGAAALSDTVLQLAPNESRVVRARIRTPEGMNAAADDVVELIASYAGDRDADRIRGSSRVTVVPEPSRAIERFLRIPARVNLRAATAEGVSPFEVFGQGPLRDRGTTRFDFLVRAPTGTASAFGERDEYRIELRAPEWRVRGGDHVYSLSSLTAAGQPGFGAGADGDYGMFSAGAYSQQFRRIPERATEHAAFVAVRPLSGAQLAVNRVDRADGPLPGSISSASGMLERWGYSSEVELARSSSASGTGMARNARLSGSTGPVSIDLGHLHADTTFSGAQRGGEHNYLSAHSAPFGVVSFGFNGSLHRTDLSRTTGVPYEERFRTASLSATLFERYTLEAGNVGRGTVVSAVREDGEQWLLRGRGDHDFSFATLTVELEGGRTTQSAGTRNFSDVGVAVRRALPWGHASMYAQRYSGGALTKGIDAAQTLGGDASVRFGKSTHATVIGYATRQETARAEWHSQIDALVSRGLRHGGILTLRARLLGGGSRTGSQQNVMYLEYGMPLRLPVGPLRTPGRVTGRVVDAVSGRGVPGALVRLGPQVAITDKDGEVSFGGVPGGQHRLSMSQETSFANAVFVGDPTLTVDSTRVKPTSFSLAIARSARVDVDVRRFATVRTAVAAGTDSLAEAGAVSNATLILAGERDTLFRSTTESGKATFTDIPPGVWTLTIRGDTPAFTRFDPDRVELVLEPGASKAVAFRLVPRRREVQMIGDGQELRATTADPKAGSQPAPAARTVKPDEKRP